MATGIFEAPTEHTCTSVNMSKHNNTHRSFNIVRLGKFIKNTKPCTHTHKQIPIRDVIFKVILTRLPNSSEDLSGLSTPGPVALWVLLTFHSPSPSKTFRTRKKLTTYASVINMTIPAAVIRFQGFYRQQRLTKIQIKS